MKLITNKNPKEERTIVYLELVRPNDLMYQWCGVLKSY